jgi:hypothetical protein
MIISYSKHPDILTHFSHLRNLQFAMALFIYIMKNYINKILILILIAMQCNGSYGEANSTPDITLKYIGMYH